MSQPCQPFPNVDVAKEQPTLKNGKFSIDISKINELQLPRYAIETSKGKEYVRAKDLTSRSEFQRVEADQAVQKGDIIVVKTFENRLNKDTDKMERTLLNARADIVVEAEGNSIKARGVHSDGVSTKETQQIFRASKYEAGVEKSYWSTGKIDKCKEGNITEIYVLRASNSTPNSSGRHLTSEGKSERPIESAKWPEPRANKNQKQDETAVAELLRPVEDRERQIVQMGRELIKKQAAHAGADPDKSEKWKSGFGRHVWERKFVAEQNSWKDKGGQFAEASKQFTKLTAKDGEIATFKSELPKSSPDERPSLIDKFTKKLDGYIDQVTKLLK